MNLTRKKTLLLLFLTYTIISYSLYQFLVIFPPSKTLGDSYRLFFFHIPTPLVAFLAFTVTLFSSILYLKTADLKWDDLASSSVKLGFIFSALAMVTGWVFTYEAWNTTWSWDPKVVTMFILCFLYLGYFTLRQATFDPVRKARTSAIYGIMAYLSIPLTYMSSRMWISLHPGGSIGLTPDMGIVAGLMVIGFMALYGYLLWFEVTYKKLEQRYASLVREADT
ncbi:MAG: cytochrome c biogenesis protein [Methanosarcinales archaeon]|nr:cytochrome c biogenesis protein [ANME-2 cluster archaeon]MDW7775778.1 cytochrome c biogenesis protein [Methanosarcinales archaeon]